ncbi:MAG: 50S ribosomal protein L22 [bacterium]|nr:50S ribosomal protein L22 [bacterium]
MEFRAVQKYVRISPRRTRLVADKVRGDFIGTALDKLTLMPQKAAGIIYKTVDSAVANAESYEPEDKKDKLDIDGLYIKEIFVDGGPVLKRISYRAYGRANRKRHRTSHITVILDEKILSDEEREGIKTRERTPGKDKKGETRTGKRKGVKNWLQERRRGFGKQGETKEGMKQAGGQSKTVPSE